MTGPPPGTPAGAGHLTRRHPAKTPPEPAVPTTLDLDGTPVTTDESQLRAAALTVCRYATDVDDARELLDMLGLLAGLRTADA